MAALVPVPAEESGKAVDRASVREVAEGLAEASFMWEEVFWPQAISTPDPNYTEEARRTKTQGTCILGLIVDAEGHPRDTRVVRGLGSGLDAKAIEAVERVALRSGKARMGSP